MIYEEKIKLEIDYAGISDIGKVRPENQDTLGKFPEYTNDIYRPKGILFIIADGMGGHEKGKIASNIAVETIGKNYFSIYSKNISESLRQAFEIANDKIFNYSSKELQSRKMGTTCTALVLNNNNAFIAHIGDSRIYGISDNNIKQLTHDHTAVNEMFRKGILSREEADIYPNKSMLVRAMGVESQIDIEIKDNIHIKSGDYFVLCSDGLSSINKNEIKEIVLSNSPEEASKIFVNLANERDGKDNVSVQVIKIKYANTDPYFSNEKRNKKSTIKWIGLVSVIVVLLIVFIYLIKILTQSNESELNDIKNNMIKKNDFSVSKDKLKFNNDILNANEIYKIGNLDSALTLYNQALKKEPTQLKVLNKIDLIYNDFVNQGDQLLLRNDFKKAIIYYKKAEVIKPNDKKIINLIKYCDNKEATNQSEVLMTNFQDDSKRTKFNSGKIISSKNQQDPFYKSSNWFLGELQTTDYNFLQDSIIFKNTPKIKKIIFNKYFSDVDIQIKIHLINVDRNSEVGLIVGYNRNKIEEESFFSITTNQKDNIALKKTFNNTSKELFSAPIEINSDSRCINLKIRCLGPWLMVYYNQNLLKAWLDDNIIEGRIGLYASSKNFVKFSNTSFKNILVHENH